MLESNGAQLSSTSERSGDACSRISTNFSKKITVDVSDLPHA